MCLVDSVAYLNVLSEQATPVTEFNYLVCDRCVAAQVATSQ
jgi:hypothetical protein